MGKEDERATDWQWGGTLRKVGGEQDTGVDTKKEDDFKNYETANIVQKLQKGSEERRLKIGHCVGHQEVHDNPGIASLK